MTRATALPIAVTTRATAAASPVISETLMFKSAPPRLASGGGLAGGLAWRARRFWPVTPPLAASPDARARARAASQAGALSP
jgi:hypothetical protein